MKTLYFNTRIFILTSWRSFSTQRELQEAHIWVCFWTVDILDILDILDVLNIQKPYKTV